MHITMVKKRFANGDACNKCIQAEQLLKERGFWSRVDKVVWAEEDDPASEGMQLAAKHDVSLAPFFIVEPADGEQKIYTSALRLLKDQLGKVPKSLATRQSSDSKTEKAKGLSPAEVEQAAIDYSDAPPENIIRFALERYGESCAIAFSGAEDVALIDMAVQTGLPFSVFCLDTGRLHEQTYEFIERVRTHYGIEIQIVSPDAEALQILVQRKGLFSFYKDGHTECCGVRKVEPLRRTLLQFSAWMTGQRHDQSPATRGDLPVLQLDPAFSGQTEHLVKFNPLAEVSSTQLWDYIRENAVPYNSLHDQGFVSIGCAPCTRARRPGEHERAARWWWEEATQRECGLHVPSSAPKKT